MANIIFLDIDGVLNTQKHLKRQHKETGHMSSLNWSPIACRHVSLLCDHYDARIVVSSTWRYNHNLDELRRFFTDNGIDPDLVIDSTPALIHEEQPGAFRRGDEIARWLEENDHGTYVIIDDLPESRFREEQQPYLVVVKQDKGFAEKQAAVRAGEILEGRE